MAKKKKVAKKKAPKNLREYHKQRMKGKKPVSIKKTIKKGIKYAKENPYKTAAGVAAMHPGVRAVTGITKLVKGGAKVLKKAGASAGPATRRALGTKVKGGGKVYKTKAQAEVAAGGTGKMVKGKLVPKKNIKIDKTKGGYRVNPSRSNVAKSPKTFAVAAGGAAAYQTSKNTKTAPAIVKQPKKKAKDSKKKPGQTPKMRGYRDPMRDTTKAKKKYGGKKDTQSGRMSTSRPVRRAIKKSGALVKKKKRKDVAGSGAKAFRRRLGGY